MGPIPSLIFNLLAQRRTVILPQVGTLWVEHVPASTDPVTGAITAPVNRVLFSPEVAEGETLPEFIARQSGTELRNVKPQYIRWTVELKKGLIDGMTEIEGVGIIRPDGTVIASSELDRWLNPVEQKTVTIPVAPVAVKKKKEKSSGSSWRGIWLTALISFLVALILAGIYLYKNGKFDPWIEQWKACRAAKETPAPVVSQPTVPADSLAADSIVAAITGEIAREQQTTAETAKPEPARTEPAKPALPSESYHVIAGVYSTQQNAERFIRESGLNASQVEIIEMYWSGKYMVSVGGFATKSDADRELERWKDRFPEAWVMKRRS